MVMEHMEPMDQQSAMASQGGNVHTPAPPTLATPIRQELERLIFTGELSPGMRINETRLARRFGTSRGPLREALQYLERERLLVHIPNRGMQVRNVSRKEAFDLYTVRAALFSMAGRLLAARRPPALLSELKACVDEMDVVAAANDLDVYFPLNLQFHRLLVEGCDNPRLAEGYAAASRELTLYRREALAPAGSLTRSNHMHRDILHAIETGDAERAGAVMLHHILINRDRALALAQGVPGNDADATGELHP